MQNDWRHNSVDLFARLTSVWHFYTCSNYPFSLTMLDLGIWASRWILFVAAICRLHISYMHID